MKARAITSRGSFLLLRLLPCANHQFAITWLGHDYRSTRRKCFQAISHLCDAGGPPERVFDAWPDEAASGVLGAQKHIVRNRKGHDHRNCRAERKWQIDAAANYHWHARADAWRRTLR